MGQVISRDTSTPINGSNIAAMVGKTVCLKANGNELADAILQRTDYGAYYVKVDNKRYVVNDSYTLPTYPISGVELYEVVTSITATSGSSITRSGGGGEETVTIESLTPRDQFALAAFEKLLERVQDPVEADYSTIMLVSAAAYRWASGMMQAASDARAADATLTESTESTT